MSAAEIDALKEIHETERQAEEIIRAAEKEAEFIIRKSRSEASTRFNDAEAMLRQEAAKHFETAIADAEIEIAKLMDECKADISNIARVADERRENAIQRLKVLVLDGYK